VARRCENAHESNSPPDILLTLADSDSAVKCEENGGFRFLTNAEVGGIIQDLEAHFDQIQSEGTGEIEIVALTSHKLYLDYSAIVNAVVRGGITLLQEVCRGFTTTVDASKLENVTALPILPEVPEAGLAPYEVGPPIFNWNCLSRSFFPPTTKVSFGGGAWSVHCPLLLLGSKYSADDSFVWRQYCRRKLHSISWCAEISSWSQGDMEQICPASSSSIQRSYL